MKPYEKHHRQLAAAAGVRTVWTLPNPSGMTITKLVVSQVGGDPAAFSVTLFNSKRVLNGSMSSGGDEPDGVYAGDPSLYLVTDELPSDSAGRLARFYHEGNGLSFCNMDGGSTNQERKLYLQIEIPVGTGDTVWDVAVGGWSDVG